MSKRLLLPLMVFMVLLMASSAAWGGTIYDSTGGGSSRGVKIDEYDYGNMKLFYIWSRTDHGTAVSFIRVRVYSNGSYSLDGTGPGGESFAFSGSAGPREGLQFRAPPSPNPGPPIFRD